VALRKTCYNSNSRRGGASFTILCRLNLTSYPRDFSLVYYDMKGLRNASYLDCIEVRQDISPIQKEYKFCYDDIHVDGVRTKNIMH
jgi:hypothetical protein